MRLIYLKDRGWKIWAFEWQTKRCFHRIGFFDGIARWNKYDFHNIESALKRMIYIFSCFIWIYGTVLTKYYRIFNIAYGYKFKELRR